MRGADRHGGWRNHYERTKRWQGRAASALNDLPRTEFHEALDFTLAYFVWCHSLREWLIQDNAIGGSLLDDELSRHPEWKIVRDLANRTRHLEITRNPTDAGWLVFREYDPFAPEIEQRERHCLVLLFGGERFQLVDLVGQSGRMWLEVLTKLGLYKLVA